MFKHKPHALTWVLSALFLIAVFTFAFAVKWLYEPVKTDTRYGVTFSTLYAEQPPADVLVRYRATTREFRLGAV